MKVFPASVAALVLLCFTASPAPAQRKPVLPPQYAKWLNEDVVYIISKEERQAFLQLPDDAARDVFMKEFWEVRNPLRGADRNPFREEHYRRIEYANATFGRETGTPGWRTDMGRTYILFGKPVSRQQYKGYSQIYPIELWMYENNTGSPSLPPFFFVMFFMPEDIGDYRFYHPIIDGPMKLVRGSQFNSNRDVYNFLKPISGDLARAPFTFIPGEPLDTEEFKPSMTGEMLVNKILEFANDSFEVKRIRELRYLRARVNSWFLVNDQQPLDLAWIVLADQQQHYWLDYAVMVDHAKFGHVDPTGDNMVINAGYRLLTENGRLILEDNEERTYPAYDADKNFHPFLLANRIAMVPGTYKLEVLITNRDAGRTYKAERTVKVGGAAQATLTGPLLAASVRAAEKPDPNVPFQYFGVQFVPEVGRPFPRAGRMRALLQIAVPPGDTRDYQLDYTLASIQDRQMRKTLTDDVKAAEFRNSVLLKAKTLPLDQLEPGNYQAVFTLHAPGSPQAVASISIQFKIGAPVPEPSLYFAANARATAAGPVAAYMRALEALSQNRRPEATEYLRASLDMAPSNVSAAQTLVQLYFDSRAYKSVAELYGKVGLTLLESTPETVAAVALSLWETGNSDNARRVLAAGNSRFPKNALLAAAANRMKAR